MGRAGFLLLYLPMSMLCVCAVVAAQAPLDPIASYRTWKKVNAKPIYMEPAVAAACLPRPIAVSSKDNPHVPTYFTVYVNATGERAMLSSEPVKLPAGSIVVKEKRVGSPDAKVKLLTVLIKRQRGYATANGDWQYLVVDGTDLSHRTTDHLEHCKSCHAEQKKDDYLFRDYLPGRVGTSR